jgi:hypothetical protein
MDTTTTKQSELSNLAYGIFFEKLLEIYGYSSNKYIAKKGLI